MTTSSEFLRPIVRNVRLATAASEQQCGTARRALSVRPPFVEVPSCVPCPVVRLALRITGSLSRSLPPSLSLTYPLSSDTSTPAGQPTLVFRGH